MMKTFRFPHPRTRALALAPLLALVAGGCPTEDDDDADTPEAGSDETAADETAGDDDDDDDDADGTTGGSEDETGADETGGPDVGGDSPCAMACADGLGGVDGLVWYRAAGQEPTDHCGTYHMGISETASVAVFSMFQDSVEYHNDGDEPIELVSIRAYARGEDGRAGEWIPLSNAELSLPPLQDDEVAGTVLAPGDSFSFTLEGMPYASGERQGCVVAETESGEHYINVSMLGSTDPMLEFSDHVDGPDDQEWAFGSQARAENAEGELVVADGWYDEEMGPGAFDGEGNVYISGVATTNLLQVTPVAKLDTDGNTAWVRILEGNALDGEAGTAHLHPKKVTDQTGDVGSSEAMLVDEDDNIYVVSNWEDGGAHRGVIVKLDPEGTVLFSRSFLRDDGGLANSGSWFHAVAKLGDRLLVTGDVYSGYSGDPLLLLLDAENGDMISAHALVAQPGSANPAWSVCADGDDRVVITGGSNDGVVASLSGLSVDTPQVDWISKIDVEGAGVKGTSCDIDGEGVAYVAYFGLSTQNRPSLFAVDPDGLTLWTGQIGNLGSSRNLAQTIVHDEGSIYLGGVLSLSGLDTTAGEGLLMKLDAADGALDWAAIYYSGKGTEETSTHGFKGIGVRDGELLLTGQAYTGLHNIDWYKGYWYDAETAGAEYGPIKDDSGEMLTPLPNHDPEIAIVTLDEGFMTGTDEIMQVLEPPSLDEVDGLDPEVAAFGFEPLRENAGPGTDADGLVQIVTVD